MSLKETDLNHIKLSRTSRSIAKAVRRKKAEKDFSRAEEMWKKDQNKPNHIRGRIKGHLEKVYIVAEKFHPKEFQEELKKLEQMSPEQAKKELKNYNKIIIPKEGEKELDFNKIEDVETYITHGPKGRERLEWIVLFSGAYPKLMSYLFSVNGQGKTNLEKLNTRIKKAI